jgi:hypothetical protein
VDAEPELAARFEVQSLPTFLFYYRGRPLAVWSTGLGTVDGGIVGGVNRATLERVTKNVLAKARTGATEIEV